MLLVILGDCAGFQCLHNVQDDTCESSREQLCNNKHLCIHTSLQCNELPNCGYSDMSDENKCKFVIMTPESFFCQYVKWERVTQVMLYVLMNYSICKDEFSDCRAHMEFMGLSELWKKVI